MKRDRPSARFLSHRLALAPLVAPTHPHLLQATIHQLGTFGEERFLHFLQQQGLAPLWSELLGDNPETALHLAPEFLQALKKNRLDSTAGYLLQQQALPLIRRTLDGAGITHAVFKGAQLRESCYAKPALRPATDIDVLVSPADRVSAISAFLDQGFTLYAPPKNISHEVCLYKGSTYIDLHWDILRPGRTRIAVAGSILEQRRDCGVLWAPSEAATLFLALVHPVFTKHVTTPQASLIRQVDLALLLQQQQWPTASTAALVSLAEDTGLRSAAWLSLKWHELLVGGSDSLQGLVDALQPGIFKARYLNRWLRDDLASRLARFPILVHAGLTLPVHDRLRDVVRAVAVARRLRRQAADEVKYLNRQLAAASVRKH
ncbi:MAG: nucleotidyltransferase family protein [Parahaliea sp.]